MTLLHLGVSSGSREEAQLFRQVLHPDPERTCSSCPAAARGRKIGKPVGERRPPHLFWAARRERWPCWLEIAAADRSIHRGEVRSAGKGSF